MSHRMTCAASCARRSPRERLGAAVLAALLLGPAVTASAGTSVPVRLDAMTRGAARVFRGRCVAARVETIAVAGAHLPVTTYTFHVSDALKGPASRAVTFRQVGTPDAGPRDLGRLAGLPTYAPGVEYLLFLLPESAAGLTSPVGAREGAFRVDGDRVRGLRGAPRGRGRARGHAGVSEPTSYRVLREALRREVER